MSLECRYRGRVITPQDIAFIRQLIAGNPSASRRRLSEKLCEVWQWKQANGALRAMVCRGLLLMLHRAGEIELPPVRFTTLNPFLRREPPAPMLIDMSPIAGALTELRPVELQQVRRTADEPLFNSLMEQHHYLAYEQPVGEHLKYLVWARIHDSLRPIACLAWSSAPRHLGSRDRYIGWNAEARRRNIRFIAYNTRFLDPALGARAASGVAHSRTYDGDAVGGLAAHLLSPGLLRGNLHRSRPLSRHLLSRGQLAVAGRDDRARQERSHQKAKPSD